jgi:hypothetical protein
VAEVASLSVDAGGHQLRGGSDDRECGFGVDEVVELRLVLGFDNCDWDVRFVVKNVVGFFGCTALHRLAAHNYAPFGEVNFFANLSHQVPFLAVRTDDGGSDERGADVCLCKFLLIHLAGLLAVTSKSP